MALKAGRVGVAPDQVDEFGKIHSEATEGYTKQEADAKFQQMQLQVPIKYLQGSSIGLFETVQDALSGSYGENGALTNEDLTSAVTNVYESVVTDIIEGATSPSSFGGNHLVKTGKLVQMDLSLEGVTTTTAWTDVLARVPDGYRPKNECFFKDIRSNNIIAVRTDGRINAASVLTSANIAIHAVWYIA